MLKKSINFSIILIIPFIIIWMLFSLDVSRFSAQYPADIIVSLGGDESRDKKALELCRKNYSLSNKLILTGVPFTPGKNIMEDNRLRHSKVYNDVLYEAVSNIETKNTWDEALYIKRYMLIHNYKSVIIVTHPLHSGRVKMCLDRIAHFKDAGLEYTIISDRNVDFLNSFFNDKYFRDFALLEMIKHLGYEIKALGYNIILMTRNIYE